MNTTVTELSELPMQFSPVTTAGATGDEVPTSRVPAAGVYLRDASLRMCMCIP